MVQPVEKKGQFPSLFSLLTISISALSMVKSVWDYVNPSASPIVSSSPAAASTTVKKTVEVVTKNSARKAASVSKAASSASGVLGLMSYWAVWGLAGLAGAVGAAYLVKRYWSEPGVNMTNTNNNHLNINFHFTGVTPAAPPVVEKKGDETHIYLQCQPS